MRIRVRRIDWADLPPHLQPFEKAGQTFIRDGQEYDVQAISVFKGIVFMLILESDSSSGSGHPGSIPAWHASDLFDVVDQTLPADWVVNAFRDEPALVVGPPIVAKDLDSYTAVVEQESPAIAVLLRRAWSLPPRDGEQ